METIKENITATAMEQFKRLGIRNVSIDSVCAEIRISKKTFYQYFESKETLIREALHFEQLNNVEKFTKAVKDKNAIEVFIYTIKEIRRFNENESFILWHDLKKYYPALHQELESRKSEMLRTGFSFNISQGISEGFYREDIDIEMLSFFHSVIMKNAFEEMIQADKKYSLKRIVDFFIDLMIHFIVNEKGMRYLQENYYDTK